MDREMRASSAYAGMGIGVLLVLVAGLIFQRRGIAGFFGMIISLVLFFLFSMGLLSEINENHATSIVTMVLAGLIMLVTGYLFFRNLFYYISLIYRGLVFLAKSFLSRPK